MRNSCHSSVGWNPWMPAFAGMTILVAWFSASTYASQPLTRLLSGSSVLSIGEFDGTQLTSSGKITLGYPLTTLSSSLPGPITAMARSQNGNLYVATSAPARVWQIQNGQIQVVFKNDKPLVTALVALQNGEIAVVTAPSGGVHFVTPGVPDKTSYVEVPQANLLLGAEADGDSVYLVGGGDTGQLLKLSRSSQQITVLARVNETHLRSIEIERGEASIYLGGAHQGTIYHYQNGLVSSIYSAGISEITAIKLDKKGRLFVAYVNDEAGPGEEGNPQKAVHMSGVVRMDRNRAVSELWRSSNSGVYALAIDEASNRILIATGPNGQLLGVDWDGQIGTQVLLSKDNHREMSTLLWGDKGQLIIGTAYQSDVYALDLRHEAAQGMYLSRVIDMGAMSKVGNILVNGDPKFSAIVSFRVGNTPTVDSTWTDFKKGLPLAQYVQIKVELRSKSHPVDQIRLTYLPVNRAPRIQSIRVLPPTHHLGAQPVESPAFATLTLDALSFANLANPLNYAPTFTGSTQALIKERPGARSIYVVAADPDADQLQYRYTLQRSGMTQIVKDWSTEPMLNLDTFKTADGRYSIQVEVNDLLTNGPSRVLKDTASSETFVIANSLPVLTNGSAKIVADGVRVYFVADAKVPLILAHCSVDGKTWLPIDPKDGMTDSMHEIYEVVLPGVSPLRAVSCEVSDEASNSNRVDIPY